MDVELKQLRYFVAVAEDLNFTAAARRLYVSQQALSRTIQQIERDLGATLLERTTRSVRLTTAGRALLDSSRRTLASADDAVAAVRRVAGAPSVRPIRVDLSSSGLQTGALVVRRLRRDRPDIPVEQVEDGVPRGLAALGAGRLDALFGLATYCPPDLRAELIRAEPVLVAMSRSHPLAASERVPVSRLADVELLLPAEDAAPEWIQFVTTLCRQVGFTPKRYPGATHGQPAHIELLRDSVAVAPTVSWTDPPASLVFRPLVDPEPTFPWTVMTAAAGQRPEVEALLEAARAVAAEQGWLQSAARPTH